MDRNTLELPYKCIEKRKDFRYLCDQIELTTMFKVIGIMFAGILVGYMLRKQSFIHYTGTLISIAIFLLLFLLGIAVGTNKQIVNNLSVLGLQAFAISSAAVLGSVICAWMVYRFIYKRERP